MELVPATLWSNLYLPSLYTLLSLYRSTLCCFSFIPFHSLSFKLSLLPSLSSSASARWCLWEWVVWLNGIANATADTTPPNSLTYFFWAAFIRHDISSPSALSLFHSSLPIQLSVAHTLTAMLYHCCTSAPRPPALLFWGCTFSSPLSTSVPFFVSFPAVSQKEDHLWDDQSVLATNL